MPPSTSITTDTPRTSPAPGELLANPDTSWKPAETPNPAFGYLGGPPLFSARRPTIHQSEDFAAGDPYTAASLQLTNGTTAVRDPIRVAAVWISIAVVATAGYSLIWGSTL